MNVICLGARIIGIELAKEVLRSFTAASFIPEPRFQRRLDKLLDIEKQRAGSMGDGTPS
jgi:ribose 5-phosphate isomerase B